MPGFLWGLIEVRSRYNENFLSKFFQVWGSEDVPFLSYKHLKSDFPITCNRKFSRKFQNSHYRKLI